MANYDDLQTHAYSHSARAALPTIELRRFNNARKRELITRFCNVQCARVLDLGGGKGGDLQKWDSVGACHVTILDKSSKSLEEAVRRHKEMKTNMRVKAVIGDFCNDPYPAFVDGEFDIVSCQYALHYVPSEEQLRQLLLFISRVLCFDGIFICTLPNAARVRHFRNNTLCTVTPYANRLYLFNLSGAVERSVEFYIEFETLCSFAKEAGLTLIYYQEHADVYSRELTGEQRDIANLYCSYAFRKTA